jgi:hypothetical protein
MHVMEKTSLYVLGNKLGRFRKKSFYYMVKITSSWTLSNPKTKIMLYIVQGIALTNHLGVKAHYDTRPPLGHFWV